MRAGREASLHGATLLAGSSRSCGVGGGRWDELPCSGASVRGERGLGGEVVSAASSDGQRGGEQDGRSSSFCAGVGAGLAVGADRREAGPDLAGAGGGAGRSRGEGELLCGLALLRPREGDFQKKACTRPSRTGRTWPGSASAGDGGRRGLSRRGRCSSTRPGPRPT